MIQRIQSLYLLVAAVLLAVVNFFPLAHCKVGEGFYTIDSCGVHANGLEAYAGTTFLCWLLPVFSAVAVLLVLLALFGFKNRIKQMRRCVYAILVIIGYYVVFGAEVWSVKSTTGVFPDLALLAELPLIAIILIFLSGRAIKRDEDLVRSMDRIR